VLGDSGGIGVVLNPTVSSIHLAWGPALLAEKTICWKILAMESHAITIQIPFISPSDQRFQPREFLTHGREGKLIQPVGVEKLLEVQREHVNFANAAHGDGGSLRQCYAQQRAAGDEGEAIILGQEF